MTYIISFRRTFKVNVQKKMFYSHILQRTFYLEVSVHALRTIIEYIYQVNLILNSLTSI